MLLHATSIAIHDKAVLLAGPSGVGKSDLALRLIDGGASLVADDQTQLTSESGKLLASPPDSLKGLFEARHIGLMRLPYVRDISVALYVELTATDADLERLPEQETIFLLDHAVPRLRLPSFAASTPAKIRAFLSYPLVPDAS